MSSFLINSVTKLLTKTRKKPMRRPTKGESARILNFMQWNRRRTMKQKEEMMANSMDYTKLKKKTLKIYMEMWRLTKVVDETKWNVCRNEYKYYLISYLCHCILNWRTTLITHDTFYAYYCSYDVYSESELWKFFTWCTCILLLHISRTIQEKKDCWRFHYKKNWLRKLHSSIHFFHIEVRAPNAHTILTFTKKKKKQKN